jgi:NCS1 family nucleobase:cation symporter-1
LSATIDVGDPVALLGSGLFSPVAKIVASFGLVLATLSTNIAANVVAPANAFVALFGRGGGGGAGGLQEQLQQQQQQQQQQQPKSIKASKQKNASSSTSFNKSVTLVGFLGTICAPWRLLNDPTGFIWVWLVGHAAVLAPVTGVLLFDYHVVKKRNLNVDGLYDQSEKSAYWYENGINKSALYSFAVGAAFCLPGFLHACGVQVFSQCPLIFKTAYQHAWFVGFFSSGIAHVALSKVLRKGL